MPTRVVQRDAAVEKLAEIVNMRRQLCDEHVAAENQAAHLEDAMLRRLSKRRQMRLEADIRLLDKRLAEMVAANVALAQRYELLTSMPGVGPVPDGPGAAFGKKTCRRVAYRTTKEQLDLEFRYHRPQT